MTAEERVRAAASELVEALVALALEAAPKADAPDRLLSIAEAAEAAGISRTLLYAEIGAGRVRTIKVGRRRLVPASALAEIAGR